MHLLNSGLHRNDIRDALLDSFPVGTGSGSWLWKAAFNNVAVAELPGGFSFHGVRRFPGGCSFVMEIGTGQ